MIITVIIIKINLSVCSSLKHPAKTIIWMSFITGSIKSDEIVSEKIPETVEYRAPQDVSCQAKMTI